MSKNNGALVYFAPDGGFELAAAVGYYPGAICRQNSGRRNMGMAIDTAACRVSAGTVSESGLKDPERSYS